MMEFKLVKTLLKLKKCKVGKTGHARSNKRYNIFQICAKSMDHARHIIFASTLHFSPKMQSNAFVIQMIQIQWILTVSVSYQKYIFRSGEDQPPWTATGTWFHEPKSSIEMSPCILYIFQYEKNYTDQDIGIFLDDFMISSQDSVPVITYIT